MDDIERGRILFACIDWAVAKHGLSESDKLLSAEEPIAILKVRFRSSAETFV
jgi:hypothetical protein